MVRLPLQYFIFVGLLLVGLDATGSNPAFAAPVDDSQQIWPALMIWDTGINPYHVDFRLPDGFEPPTGYYLEDAIPVYLTLDAASYEEARAADDALWNSLEYGQLYSFPGTKVVGAIETDGTCISCLPPIIDHDGHGTFVASSLVGVQGSCRECRIVSATGAEQAIRWAIGRPDVDAISNSQGSVAGVGLTLYTDALIDDWIKGGRTWFTAGGNGGTAYANHLDSWAAHPDVMRVGKGEAPEYGGTRTVEIVADHLKHVANHDSFTDHSEQVGTSLSAPDAAGWYLQGLHFARSILRPDQPPNSVALVVAGPTATVPVEGPLSDGQLTARELEDLLRQAAVQRAAPVFGAPPELAYFWEGYGFVGPEAAIIAESILSGHSAVPAKPWADYWRAYDQAIRDAIGGHYAQCRSQATQLAECAQSQDWEPTGMMATMSPPPSG